MLLPNDCNAHRQLFATACGVSVWSLSRKSVRFANAAHSRMWCLECSGMGNLYEIVRKYSEFTPA